MVGRRWVILSGNSFPPLRTTPKLRAAESQFQRQRSKLATPCARTRFGQTPDRALGWGRVADAKGPGTVLSDARRWEDDPPLSIRACKIWRLSQCGYIAFLGASSRCSINPSPFSPFPPSSYPEDLPRRANRMGHWQRPGAARRRRPGSGAAAPRKSSRRGRAYRLPPWLFELVSD